MSNVTINDVNVIGGSILMPLNGVWTADLVIDQPDGTGFDAGTSVSIACDGGLTFTGTVAQDRTGSFLDAVHVRVLGGAGGMAKTATARGYVQPSAFVSDVLNGLTSDSGETLSTDIAASFLGQNLTAWNTFAVPCSQVLTTLLSIVSPASSWRITADGKLFILVESWPENSFTFETIDQNPTERSFLLGVDAFQITPGMNVDTIGNVARVEHVIDADKTRSHVWTYIQDDDRGPLVSINKMIDARTAPIDYYAMYDAQVVSQSADGTTVDIQPGDARLSGLSKVPLRLGLPGTTVMFAPGQFVRLGWDRGSPERPFACLFQGGETVTSMQLAGTHPLPLWDTFLADFATALGYINASNGGGPIISDSVDWAAFIAKLSAPTYKSQIVSNG